MKEAGRPKSRILGLDSLRGICLLFMVLYHLFYDLSSFFGCPAWIADNPFAVFCQLFSSSGFILIAGVSSRLSSGNIRRGIRVLTAGCLVAAAAFAWGAPILFGILQFLGCAMILYGLTHGFWNRIPEQAAPVLYLALFVLTGWLVSHRVSVDCLFPLGLISPDFSSADYYPIFPNIFVFLLGTWAGKYALERRLPQWFLSWKVPGLSFLGRHSLAAYLLHQPLLIALLYGLSYLAGRFGI